MSQLRVPPYNQEDIIAIIRDAIEKGIITSTTTYLDPTETYTLKVVKGVLTLVEDE